MLCALYALDSFETNTKTLIQPETATRLFGLFDPEPVLKPPGSVVRTEKEGFWEILRYQEHVAFKCLCGRSDPFLLTNADFERSKLLRPEAGCPICQEQMSEATTKGERLKAWLESRRAVITPDAHLELPEDCGRLYSKDCTESNQTAIVRTRYFVFTEFFRKPVPPGMCVRTTCSNRKCINPFHLCLTPNPNTKVSEDQRLLIGHWISSGISPKTIQRLLHEQHCLELSLRSIQRIAREQKKSSSCVT